MNVQTDTPIKLRLQGVGKSFIAPRTGETTLAVTDVNLDIQSGEFICIVGPSGCGKSTILNMVAGLDRPTTGTIEKDGIPITGPGADRGVMFQDYALMPWQTVQENVGFGLRYGTPGKPFTPPQREERIRHFIDLVTWAVPRRNTPTSCRAACDSAWRWHVYWPTDRTFC